ncbi:hypothetical protein VNO77_33023 [Canavalia gladiata]|uniref:Uncharacterized protein n=1 Tax=Canavalia gladiata TaxID=3824 RepID=A0AAN9KD34_CANGL
MGSSCRSLVRGVIPRYNEVIGLMNDVTLWVKPIKELRIVIVIDILWITVLLLLASRNKSFVLALGFVWSSEGEYIVAKLVVCFELGRDDTFSVNEDCLPNQHFLLSVTMVELSRQFAQMILFLRLEWGQVDLGELMLMSNMVLYHHILVVEVLSMHKELKDAFELLHDIMSKSELEPGSVTVLFTTTLLRNSITVYVESPKEFNNLNSPKDSLRLRFTVLSDLTSDLEALHFDLCWITQANRVWYSDGLKYAVEMWAREESNKLIIPIFLDYYFLTCL